MRLTEKLFRLIYKAFDRTPGAFLAMCIDADGPLFWQVEDGFLTLTPGGVIGHGRGIAQPQSIDLSQYSLTQLATYLAGLAGYTVSNLVLPPMAELSALVLLDASGSTTDSNGDQFWAYSNPNWAYLEALSAELELARQQIQAMPDEMATPTANGEWLDYLGRTMYAVPRLVGEADADYAPRIPAEVLQPRANNLAIEEAIVATIGQDCTVSNVIEYGAAFPLHNGAITRNGTHFHNATATPIYGLFDVSTTFDLLGSSDFAASAVQITALVDRFRAAGTFMRAINVNQGAQISDAPGSSPTDAIAGYGGALTEADSAPAPLDAPTSLLSVGDSLADTLASKPTDSDTLQVECYYRHDGTHLRGGTIMHSGNLRIAEVMDSSTPISWSMLYFILCEDGRSLADETGAPVGLEISAQNTLVVTTNFSGSFDADFT